MAVDVLFWYAKLLCNVYLASNSLNDEKQKYLRGNPYADTTTEEGQKGSGFPNPFFNRLCIDTNERKNKRKSLGNINHIFCMDYGM